MYHVLAALVPTFRDSLVVVGRKLAGWTPVNYSEDADRAAASGQILSKLIDGRLLLTPHTEKTPAYYEFSGTGTLTGLLSGIVPHKVASPTGFEPVS